ncbi:MAG: hypothetical protein ACI4RP_08475 [Acutalibacteraceae bacterium]
MTNRESQHLLYSNLPNTIIAFHGCDKSTFENVLYNHKPLKVSNNDYDWLGNGIYFWENNLKRAWEWAEAGAANPKMHINNPAVIGAVIDLGLCLDLTNSYHIKQLQKQYQIFKMEMEFAGLEMPINKNIKGNSDLLLRRLDCAVIEYFHMEREVNRERSYDSVRGVFIEGKEIYETSGFREKTHIQLCIRNPNCIKGYFAPQIVDNTWIIP